MTDAFRMSPEKLLEETRWLQSLAVSLAGRADPEDLAQTTWLRAVEGRDRIRGLRPWLRTVLGSVLSRSRRDQAARMRRERAAARPESLPAAADLVARTMLHRAVADAVLELEEPARSTVLLRFVDDCPPREIARMQGVPVATVRTRLRRALAELRGRLDRDFGGHERWVALIAPFPPAAAAASVPIVGVLLMSLKSKIAVAAACVLISIGTTIAWFARTESAGEPAPSAPPAVGEITSASAPGHATESAPAPQVSPVRPVPYAEREPDPADFPLTGRVVAAATGAPVVGAEVTCTWGALGPNLETRSARTDADGRFKLLIAHPQYQIDLDVFRADFARREVSFDNGQEGFMKAEAHDAGDIRLERGAELRGRVVDEAGAPIGGAAIIIPRQGRGRFGFHHLENGRQGAESAADGTFTLSERMTCEVEPERMLMAVSKDAFGWGWFAVATGAETVDPVTIVATRGAPLRVRVEDVERKPVPGATIMAYPRWQPLGSPRYPGEQIFFWRAPGLDSRVRDRLYATSRPDGLATFAGLPMGSRADDPRYSWGHDQLDAYDLLVEAPSFDPGRASCRVLAAHDDPIVITLERPRSRTLSGHVRDRQGRPIAGAKVSVYHGTLSAVTDDAGAYEVKGILSQWDPCPVEASAVGFGSRNLELRKSDGGEKLTWNVVLPRALPVKGRVVDETGAKVTGWTISLHRMNDPTLGAPDAAENGESGTFEFRDVAEGEWAVWAQPPDGGEWNMPPSRSIHAGDVDVEVVVTRKAEGATVIVEVVDSATGALADVAEARLLPAYIFIGGQSFGIPERKLEKGQVTFTRIGPGEWNLRIRTPDDRRVARRFEVAASERTVRLRVEVAKPGSILGRLVLDGIPVAERPDHVAVLVHADGEGRATTLDGKPIEGFTKDFLHAKKSDDYRFRFADFSPGRRVTVFVYDDRLFGHAEVDIKAAEDAPVEVRCIASATVAREVRDAPPDSRLVFYMRRPGGAPVRLDWQTDTKSQDVPVPSGPFLWRAELYELEPGSVDRTMRVLEGGLDLAPGERKPLVLEFPK